MRLGLGKQTTVNYNNGNNRFTVNVQLTRSNKMNIKLSENTKDKIIAVSDFFGRRKISDIISFSEFNQPGFIKHGRYIYIVGGIKTTCNYIEGKLHGVFTEEYGNGKVTRCTYDNGKKHGCAVTTFKDGKVRAACMYSMDKLDGEYILFLPNGKILSNLIYSNGRCIGERKDFTEGELYNMGIDMIPDDIFTENPVKKSISERTKDRLIAAGNFFGSKKVLLLEAHITVALLTYIIVTLLI